MRNTFVVLYLNLGQLSERLAATLLEITNQKFASAGVFAGCRVVGFDSGDFAEIRT